MIRYTLLLIVSLMLLVACGNKGNKGENITLSEAKNRLQNVNKALVDKDKELIDAYIERHKLQNVQNNGAGLFYLIWGETADSLIKNGDFVSLDYKITLLDGTLCYSSENSKPKEFVVGYGGVEAGLEMAMLLMRKGQRGKLILPPHLAHGLLGDNGKIPPRSIIVYDVRVKNVIAK